MIFVLMGQMLISCGVGTRSERRISQFNLQKSASKLSALSKSACKCIQQVNTDNMFALLAVALEAWQLSAFTFGTPAVPWGDHGWFDVIRQVNNVLSLRLDGLMQIALASLLHFDVPYTFQIAFLAMCTVPVAAAIAVGILFVNSATGASGNWLDRLITGATATMDGLSLVNSKPVLQAVLFIFGTLFLTFCNAFLQALACAPNGNPKLLVALCFIRLSIAEKGVLALTTEPSIVCWRGEHVYYAIVATYALVLFVPNAGTVQITANQRLTALNTEDGTPPSALEYGPTFPIFERTLKFTGIILISLLGPQSATPAFRLAVLLIVNSGVAAFLLLRRPCAVKRFNYIRGLAVLAAGWTTVPSLVAIEINDKHGWLPFVVLFGGWLVLLVIAVWLFFRLRASDRDKQSRAVNDADQRDLDVDMSDTSSVYSALI